MAFIFFLNLISITSSVNLEWRVVESPQLTLKSNYSIFRFDIFDGPEFFILDNLQNEKIFYNDFLSYKGFSRVYIKEELSMFSELWYNGKICKNVTRDIIFLFLKLNVLFRCDDNSRKRILKNILPNKRCLKSDYKKYMSSSQAITMIMLNYHFMGSTRSEYLRHCAKSLECIIFEMFNVKLNIDINDIFNKDYKLFFEMLNDIILPYDVLGDEEITVLNYLI